MTYNLGKMMSECISECAALGIQFDGTIDPYVSVNSRLRASWARCIKRMNGRYKFHIEFSPETLKSTVEKSVKETMMHEVLHCAKDGFKHTGSWKRYANMVNERYGYNVKRLDSYEDKGMERPEVKMSIYKYEMYCPVCGASWKYKTLCEAIRRPSRYKCCRCHEDLKSRKL